MGQQFDSPYTVLEVQYESHSAQFIDILFPISNKYSTRSTYSRLSSCRFSSYLQARAHKNGRLEYKERVTIGQNFPPVLKIVTRTAQAAYTRTRKMLMLLCVHVTRVLYWRGNFPLTMELHALTLVARSHALLLQDIKCSTN